MKAEQEAGETKGKARRMHWSIAEIPRVVKAALAPVSLWRGPLGHDIGSERGRLVHLPAGDFAYNRGMRLARAAIAVMALTLALGLPRLAHGRRLQLRDRVPKPLRFRGALVYVSPTAVEILEKNSLVIGALLPKHHPELAVGRLAQHAAGDEVEITARPIPEFYDTGTRRSYLLELDSVKYLGRPQAPQLQAAMDSRARLEPGSLLAPPPGAAASPPKAQIEALPEATRTAIRNWIHSFPNYLADVTELYEEEGARTGTVRRHLLAYTATVADGKIARSNLKLDGAPWLESYQTVPVYHWDGGFGYMEAFVQPECRVRIEAGARTDAKFTEPVDGFSFAGPANGCLGDLYIGYETVFAPVHGKLWIARGDRLPRRLEMSYDFPSAFALGSMELDIDWAPVAVGQGRYILPSTASNTMQQEGDSRHSQIIYTNYHQFTTSASITVIGIPSAGVARGPAAPGLPGRWTATMHLGQQQAEQFGLLISSDAEGKLSAWYIGGGSQEPVDLEANGKSVSFSRAEAAGPPFTFHGTLNSAGDAIVGTATKGDQSFAAVLKRQPQ